MTAADEHACACHPAAAGTDDLVRLSGIEPLATMT